MFHSLFFFFFFCLASAILCRTFKSIWNCVEYSIFHYHKQLNVCSCRYGSDKLRQPNVNLKSSPLISFHYDLFAIFNKIERGNAYGKIGSSVHKNENGMKKSAHWISFCVPCSVSLSLPLIVYFFLLLSVCLHRFGLHIFIRWKPNNWNGKNGITNEKKHPNKWDIMLI